MTLVNFHRMPDKQAATYWFARAKTALEKYHDMTMQRDQYRKGVETLTRKRNFWKAQAKKYQEMAQTFSMQLGAATMRAEKAEWEAQQHYDDFDALRQEIGDHRRRTKAAEAEAATLCDEVEFYKGCADHAHEHCISWRKRAEAAEAERDRLAARLKHVEMLAVGHRDCGAGYDECAELATVILAALSAPEEDQ